MTTETIAPPEPAFEGANFTMPTHSADGTPLTAKQTFHELLRVPQFVDKATQPHTMESRLLADLNARMAAEAEAPPPLPPAAPPAAFRIPVEFDADGTSAEHQAASAAVRGWLSAAGLDAETGSRLASLVAEQRRYWERQPDWSGAPAIAERELRRAWGNEYDLKLTAAQRLVAKVEGKRPGLVAFLQAGGLVNDPLFISQLAFLAEQLRDQ